MTIGLRDAPFMPSRLGGTPGSPSGLGPSARLGRLGISVSTAGTCPHTESHTKCVNGQTVSQSCTAYRNCQTGALVGTDCWNDEVCSDGGSGGGGGGAGASAAMGTPPTAADGWTKCADENQTCDWPGAAGDVAKVRYGAGTRWAQKDGIADKIGCNNSVFGDPNYGVVKACWYKPAAVAAACVSSPAQITANYQAWVGRAPNQSEIDAHCHDSDAALDTMWKAWCTANPTLCTGPDWLAYHQPPVSSVPSPGQQTTPGQATAPPVPIQECDAPMNVTLDHTERWVEVDPIKCLWQIVRTTEPGKPVVLPNVYGGTPSLIIPQSAPPAQVALDPSSVGLYQPTPIGGAVEVTDTTITQAFVDVLGRGPTPEELTAAEGQHFTNVADLYAYLHTLGGDTTGEGLGLSSAQTWVTDHPYATAGLALLGVWFLAGRRRR